jgi:hypothetical protein
MIAGAAMVIVDIAPFRIAKVLVDPQISVVVQSVAAFTRNDTYFWPPAHHDWGAATRDTQRHERP